jgi:superfamily I DNA/RNA helicase
MTLHAAKGLEFEAVFLPALEDGILPFAGPGFFSGKATRNGDRPDQDEERRLLYVGLTRAKSLLYLSHAAARTLFGRELRLTPSRFFADLDDAAMKRSTLVAHTQRKEKQLNLL